MWATFGTYMGKPHDTHIAYWQLTWDPYETGGQKLYGALMGGTVGKICGNCVQDLGPIWATHGNHMKQVDKTRMALIWVAHICHL